MSATSFSPSLTTQAPPAIRSPMTHDELMSEACRLAKESVDNNWGGPFGAVIARDGQIVARGQNRALLHIVWVRLGRVGRAEVRQRRAWRARSGVPSHGIRTPVG